MKACSSARERIIDAAEAVVLEHGAGHMTMDAVAAKARVSKGGLIYHFPSLTALLEAMLGRFTDRVTASIEEITASLPESPSRAVKAHILALFAFGDDDLRTAQALLAATARDPKLLTAARAKRREMMNRLMQSVKAPDQVAILILATEGMWLSELLGISTRTHAERQRIKESLLRHADECCGTDSKAGGPGREPPSRRKGRTR